MELKDLRPIESKFKLKTTGREYNLRPINLSDEVWLQTTFKDGLSEIFANDAVDMVALSRIAYHQLVDKSDFVKQEVVIIDEDGEESKETIGGCRLLQRMIVGMEDKLSIITAFNATMGASRPAPSEEEVKKKIL